MSENTDFCKNSIHIKLIRDCFKLLDESMDLDPNYDPSDFLKMPSRSQEPTQQQEPMSMDYHNVNIKQEPQAHQQQYEHEDQHYDQQSFDMSEMLRYQQPEEHQQQQENIDDVGIHDDLAISDSDEGELDLVVPKVENVENDNDDEGDGLWF